MRLVRRSAYRHYNVDRRNRHHADDLAGALDIVCNADVPPLKSCGQSQGDDTLKVRACSAIVTITSKSRYSALHGPAEYNCFIIAEPHSSRCFATANVLPVFSLTTLDEN
jgi:hypothetical protein